MFFSSLWGNGIKTLQYMNSFIVFSFFPPFLSSEINSVFSQDTPSLPRRLLSLGLGSACLALGKLWEHNGCFQSLMGTKWNISGLITVESLTLPSYLHLFKSLKL